MGISITENTHNFKEVYFSLFVKNAIKYKTP